MEKLGLTDIDIEKIRLLRSQLENFIAINKVGDGAGVTIKIGDLKLILGLADKFLESKAKDIRISLLQLPTPKEPVGSGDEYVNKVI